MKKLIVPVICLCICFVVFLKYSNQLEYEHVIDSAKLPGYSTAEEVKENSALIVLVKKISEEPIAYKLDEGHYDNFTLSTVRVEEVIKPVPGKEISKGDVITVIESEWTDDKEKVIHHLENYKKMETMKKYTLYLGYNEEVENYYPIGLLYGKIAEDVKEEDFYGEMKNEQVLSVVKELKEDSKLRDE